MPFALRSARGPHMGLFYFPILPEKWSTIAPDRLGKGVYPNRGVAQGTAIRILRLPQYNNDVLEIVSVEATSNMVIAG